MAKVRYVGPHTEGVDLIPIGHAFSVYGVMPGDVIDVPNDIVHGTKPTIVKGEIVDAGREPLLAQEGWELVGASARASAPKRRSRKAAANSTTTEETK